MLERGEGKKKEIDSSARLLAIPSSMLGFSLWFETSILKNPKVISPRKIRYLLRLFFRMKQVSQVVKFVTTLLQTVAIPPSARHPSIWHKPLKPKPHHREWTSKWPLLASFFLQPKSTGQMWCWRAPNIALKPSKILGLVHTQRTSWWNCHLAVFSRLPYSCWLTSPSSLIPACAGWQLGKDLPLLLQ